MSSPFQDVEATLTDKDFEQIVTALLAAYPNLEDLYALLLNRWGTRVSDVIFVHQAGRLVVTALLEWARAEGSALDLLHLAWRYRHEQLEALGALAEQWTGPRRFPLSPIVDQGPLSQFGMSMKSMPDPLARPHETPKMDVSHVMGATSLIYLDGHPVSTGFLIGRRAILTTYSAVQDAISGRSGGRVSITFESDDGSASAHSEVAAGDDWLGPWSAFAPSDVSGGAPTSDSENHLDFALIWLSEPVGHERPNLRLPTQVPIALPGSGLILAHHPNAEPLTISAGVLLNYSDQGARIDYQADTTYGSAGAPVISLKGGLIAMHHVARRNLEGSVGQGVPIWRIRKAIVDAGVDLESL